MFRALLDACAYPPTCIMSPHITKMKITAAKAIASTVTDISPLYIMLKVMNPIVVPAIRAAICG